MTAVEALTSGLWFGCIVATLSTSAGALAVAVASVPVRWKRRRNGGAAR